MTVLTYDAAWLVRGLELLDKADSADSRIAVFDALVSIIEELTSQFVVLDETPQRWTVAAHGSGVSDEHAADVAGSAPTVTLAVTPTRAATADDGWSVVGGDTDEIAVAVADATLAAQLQPVLTAARRSLKHQRLTATVLAAETEVDALRTVAGRILRARELDEALLAVTNETLSLLTSDIAGVMLRDGDEIFMRSCAGNQLADTAHLRMRRGQGLAGLVFATGEAAKVDDYLSSSVISDDFHRLAKMERTRSALAAPLTVDGDIIGVLEVWRRRESRFTPADIRRLAALAELAAIALDNARLHALSESSARTVEAAHRSVEVKLGRVEHALRVQQELIEAHIDGAQLPGLARIVGERSACQIALFDLDVQPIAAWPPDGNPRTFAAVVESARAAHGVSQQNDVTHWTELGERTAAARGIYAGREQIGWICLVGTGDLGQVDQDELDLAMRQASLAVALHHLQEQAATKARANLREEMLLQLLRGTSEERRAAIARARYLQVDMRGPLRVAVCRLAGLESLAQTGAWSEAYEYRVRRRLLAVCEGELADRGWLRLIAMHGDDLIALIRSADSAELREALGAVIGPMEDEVAGIRPLWGVSSAHGAPQELDRALDEASTATQALRFDSGRNIAVYEDLGILGLLIAGPKGMPLTDFASATLGDVITHDQQHGTSLMQTLRTYLDTNCNQRDAAAVLFVHQKTVKYRLEVIEKLTGLDLRQHRDRMRADIAVRAIDLN